MWRQRSHLQCKMTRWQWCIVIYGGKIYHKSHAITIRCKPGMLLLLRPSGAGKASLLYTVDTENEGRVHQRCATCSLWIDSSKGVCAHTIGEHAVIFATLVFIKLFQLTRISWRISEEALEVLFISWVCASVLTNLYLVLMQLSTGVLY